MSLSSAGLLTVTGGITMTGTTPTLTIGDAGAEDTKIIFDGNAQDYHIGLDDSADKLTIGLGSTLGTTSHMTFDSTGAITKPLQPAFLEKAEGTNNIDLSSAYTVIFNTERFDNNADFNTGTYTFTAPVTGRYQFNCHVRGDDEWQTAAAYFHLDLVTSNQTYKLHIFDPDNYDKDLFYHTIGGSMLVDMDASDTAYITLIQSGGTADLCIVADGSWFSGYLVC